MKQCIKCEKPVVEYKVHKMCSSCYWKSYYQLHKEERIQWQVQYNRNHKEQHKKHWSKKKTPDQLTKRATYMRLYYKRKKEEKLNVTIEEAGGRIGQELDVTISQSSI